MKKTFIVAIAVLLSATGVFAQPVVDAMLGTNEYGTGNSYKVTDGINMWYLTWTDDSLYGFIDSANRDENGVIYFDFTNNSLVNTGNGTQSGINVEDITPGVPFNADALIYFGDGGRQVRTATGASWNSATNNWGYYYSIARSGGSTSDDAREFSIAWTELGLGGRPTAMNFTAFIQYRNGSGSPQQFGGIYGQFPSENPAPTTNSNQSLAPQMTRYYHCTGMGSTPSSTPFTNNSYCHVGPDILGVGSITAYNFTMNSPGVSITRGSGASGNWIVTNNFTVNDGSVDFGATASTCQVHHLVLTGGALELSTAGGGDFALTGDWTQNGAANFAAVGRTVMFNGSSAQTVTFTGGGTVVYGGLNINNSSTGVTVASGTNLTVNNTCTFTSSKASIGSDTLRLNGDLIGFTASNCFTFNGSTILMFGGTGTPTSSFMVDQTTTGVTNRVLDLVVNRSAGTITLGNNLEVSGVVSHLNGTLASTSSAYLRLKATNDNTYAQVSGLGTGTISGSVSAEYMFGGTRTFWRQLSSPFTGTTLADYEDDVPMNFGTPNPAYTNVYYVDETQGGTPGAWRPHTGSTASLDSNGFTVWVDSTSLPVTLDIAGTYTPGDWTTHPLTRTGALADTTGYHILRNPWPSNYHHNTTLTNVQSNVLYVYEGGSVRDWNGTTGSIANGVIPPFHGIYLEVTSHNATVTFPATNRVTDNNANYFNKSSLMNYVMLRVTNPAAEWDETRVYTDPVAENGKDFWDANKIINYPVAPTIYTLAGGQKTSINVMKDIPEEGTKVPVVFKTSTYGQHTIQFTTENIDPRFEIVLEDVLMQSKHKVANGAYVFNHIEGAIENRFILHYQRKSTGPGVSVAETVEPGVFIGSNYKTVTVASGTVNGPCTVEVMDMMGRTIKTINAVDFAQTPVLNFSVDGAATGYYLVRVNGETISNTGKVYLQ